MEIVFPKSSKDRYLQLVGINGSVFAIVHSPLESNGPIHLQCDDWSLILLAPIKSKSDVIIEGINVIRLNSVESIEGNASITASNQLVNISSTIKAGLGFSEVAKCGEHRLDDESGTLMNYLKLFYDIVKNIYTDTPDSISEAQSKFISSLCTLMAKAKGKKEGMTMHQILGFWDIPILLSKTSNQDLTT